MKKVIFIIVAIVTLWSISYSQEYRDVGNAYSFKWISPSTDSAGVFSSPVFPAYDMIALYRTVVLDSGTTDGKPYEASYLEKKPYVIVQVKGTGTVDSLSSLYLYGKNPDDSWSIVDTVSTAKEVSIMTNLSFNGLPRFTELKFTGTVADLTVSAYSVRTYIELVVPKLLNGDK